MTITTICNYILILLAGTNIGLLISNIITAIKINKELKEFNNDSN